MAAEDQPVDEREGELAALAAENERLRRAYARTQRTAYRRTAAGLAGLGVLAVVGGLLLPSARTVLFALGATGLFGAILTVYLTPERFVVASVGEGVYGAMAENYSALAADLGLAETHHYVPIGDGDRVRLFVPQEGSGVPDGDALAAPLVVTDDARGLALEPTGASLVGSLAQSLPAGLASEPDELAAQLAEALVEQFELVRSADPDVDPDGNRVTVAVAGSAYGPVDRFDHPVASVLATGVARGLDRRVVCETDAAGEDDARITVRWAPDDR